MCGTHGHRAPPKVTFFDVLKESGQRRSLVRSWTPPTSLGRRADIQGFQDEFF